MVPKMAAGVRGSVAVARVARTPDQVKAIH
jgi:hypothetical protein